MFSFVKISVAPLHGFFWNEQPAREESFINHNLVIYGNAKKTEKQLAHVNMRHSIQKFKLL